MTSAEILRAAAIAALKGVTLALGNVFSPLDQPTWDGEYPLLIVTIDDEDGEGWGRNAAPAFTVVAPLKIVARSEMRSLPEDEAAAALYAQMETLRAQIKAAVINNPGLMPLIQQFKAFRTRIRMGEGETAQHQAQLTVEIDLDYIQGPEAFYQSQSVPLQGIDLCVAEPEGTVSPGLSISFTQ